MKGRWAGVAVLLASVTELRADHRAVFIPSLQIVEVNDDNLNYSPVPLSDRVRRVTPALAFRFDSPRWSARVSGGFDSEQYANQRSLNDRRARERAAVTFLYSATPRLMFSIESGYLGTNTLADLNRDTGLAASRVRGRRFSVSPSAHFQISPRTTVNASAASTVTTVVNGFGLRSQEQSVGLDRRVTTRDVLNVSYDHTHLIFSGKNSHSVRTHALLAAWTHDLGLHDRVSFHVGPRLIEGSRSADIAASLTHRWREASIAISLMRSQTTVIGYEANAETDSVQASFSYTPIHNLTTYLAPAAFRTTHAQLQGNVFRISGGARYALTSFLQADVSYNHDIQRGAVDPLQPNVKISHSTLSIGLTTRLNNRDEAR